jgi:hypothetical protein
MPWSNRITRKEGEKEIVGTYLHAFIHNGDYFLSEIKVYADAKIDCWELVDFEKFKEKVRSGWVVTQLPNNARVSISGVASFVARDVNAFIKPEEFIKEVAEEIEELNGRVTAGDRCRAAYQTFQKEQTEIAREKLKLAYEAIPEHLRRYVLRDMDEKDIPIRMIIYGEDEIEKWSHRIASRKLGLKALPSIQVVGAKPVAKKPWWKLWD